MNIKERRTKIWTGSYKGVAFEINNYKTEPNSIEPLEKDCWTYYLYIHLGKIPEENDPNSFWLKAKPDNRGRVFYKYYDHQIINNIDLSGGCTWYSKERGFDGGSKVIKIGCDYQHIWNDNHFYDLHAIKDDVINSINRFLHHIPDYKYSCCGNGKLYSLCDGIIKNGRFYSKEYYGEKEWFKELIQKYNEC